MEVKEAVLRGWKGPLLTSQELVKWDPAIVNDEDEIANTPLHYAAQEVTQDLLNFWFR